MDEIHKKGMIPGEKGIRQKRGLYFHSPSAFAKANLFYVLWGGEYVCEVPYKVKRSYLDSFLMFRILNGKLYFEYRDRKFTAYPGDIVFLDCKYPQHYWIDAQATFQYFHFDGNVTQNYFDMLYQQGGIHFTDKPELSFLFNYLFSEMSSINANDHKLSLLLHNIISILALPDKKVKNSSVATAQQYIMNHFQEELTVADIADHVAMSQYHFSRVFKQVTSMAPHQYLFNVRMKHARNLLTRTDMTVDRIAVQCGFLSTSHFIRAFKNDTKVTPVMFRKFFDPTGFKE
ncbi:MAG: AraC family transcriptional regulator [Lachnospiraceae bacterium]